LSSLGRCNCRSAALEAHADIDQLGDLAADGDGEVARIGGANGPAEFKKMQIRQVRLVTRPPSGPPERPGKFRRSAGLTRIGVAPASWGE